MKTEKDEEFGTLMLVEEYEYQANILVGGTGNRQIAANRLFRLRKDMHARIHYLQNQLKLIPKEDQSEIRCDFCFVRDE